MAVECSECGAWVADYAEAFSLTKNYCQICYRKMPERIAELEGQLANANTACSEVAAALGLEVWEFPELAKAVERLREYIRNWSYVTNMGISKSDDPKRYKREFDAMCRKLNIAPYCNNKEEADNG